MFESVLGPDQAPLREACCPLILLYLSPRSCQRCEVLVGTGGNRRPCDFESLLCVSSRNVRPDARIRPCRSNRNADDQGETAGDPDVDFLDGAASRPPPYVNRVTLGTAT